MFPKFLDNIYSYEEDNELADILYFESLKRFSEIQEETNKIDEVKHVNRILIPFLTCWGLMSRVVGREDINWTDITQEISNLRPLLGVLKGKDILTMDFTDKQVVDSIIKVYDNLRRHKYFGATTLSKTLHLLNPQVFVMWDGDILKYYKMTSPAIDDYGEGYLEFLKVTQKAINQTLTEIANQTGKTQEQITHELYDKYPYCYDKTMKKTIAKFIDEYNWTVVPRP